MEASNAKRVRNSSACETCRKRRGKCSGVAPCTYCAEHNLLCVFSASIKKRGPASKKQKGLFSFTEGSFVLYHTPDAEYKYIGEYLNHFFFLPPLNQAGIHNPTTPCHHMMRFVILSHMARSFGAITRSEEFITTARQISGQLYDEPSYDTGVAFMLLADICLANNDGRAWHYATVAWNHAKTLPRNEWSNIHLQLQSFVMSNMLDTSLSPEQKRQQLFNFASQLLDADILTTIISGLMLKTGAVGLLLNGATCKEAGLLTCLQNLTFDSSVIETMGDLDKLEYYLQNTPPIQKWVLLLFAKMFRTMLQIKLGNFSDASLAAREMVDISQRPEIRNIVKNELFLPVIMPNLATLGSLSKVVVELYHFTQQLDAEKLNNMTSSNIKQEQDEPHRVSPMFQQFFPHLIAGAGLPPPGPGAPSAPTTLLRQPHPIPQPPSTPVAPSIPAHDHLQQLFFQLQQQQIHILQESVQQTNVSAQSLTHPFVPQKALPPPPSPASLPPSPGGDSPRPPSSPLPIIPPPNYHQKTTTTTTTTNHVHNNNTHYAHVPHPQTANASATTAGGHVVMTNSEEFPLADDFWQWQNNEINNLKVDDLWNQAIMG